MEAMMSKAVILYCSRKGTTRHLGEEIGRFLKKKKIQAIALSIDEFHQSSLDDFQYVFLGCWTKGLFLQNQHPVEEWVRFVQRLTDMQDKKLGLFTTYNIFTGSMFRNMKKYVNNYAKQTIVELKSRSGKLSEESKNKLEQLCKA